MPIPFDMMAVMLYLGYYAETPTANPPNLAASLLHVAAAAFALLAAAAAFNKLLLRDIRRSGLAYAERKRRAGWADPAIRVATVGTFILALEHSALPWSLAAALARTESGDSLFIQLAGLSLYVLLFFCAWSPMYGLHREIVPGFRSRRGFLVNKARYNLFVLLAWLPFAILADWLSGFAIALPVLFAVTAWTFPYILARAWGCTRLTGGDAFDRVRKLEEKTRTRFSRIYLWEPGGGTPNAAAVGIFRPFRYIFLTPALVRSMSGEELESVILHELGHVRKKHLLFYLFTSLAGVNTAILLGAMLPLHGPGERFAVTALLVLGYFRVVFGWFSRNMERQADLFALDVSGSAAGLANALEKIGLAAGNIRLAASWHHLGIAERVSFLRRAERNGEIVARHNAKVSAVMLAGYLFAAAAIFGTAWFVSREFLPQPAPPARTTTDEAHWRRVMLVLPGNPKAPLELAYRLAGKPESKKEALAMASQALRLSFCREEKEAASKLLSELDKGDAAGDSFESSDLRQ